MASAWVLDMNLSFGGGGGQRSSGRVLEHEYHPAEFLPFYMMRHPYATPSEAREAGLGGGVS